jgi:hypothetical protein
MEAGMKAWARPREVARRFPPSLDIAGAKWHQRATEH